MQLFTSPFWNEGRQLCLSVIMLDSLLRNSDASQYTLRVCIDWKNIEAEAVHHYA